MAANSSMLHSKLARGGWEKRAEQQSHAREGSGDRQRLCMIPISRSGLHDRV
jgi:hypothetical protein